MVYNATFMVYLLLSTFPHIGEKERLSVELVLGLAVSYDLQRMRIAMSRDVYGKARVFRPQLAKLAGRYELVRVPKADDFGYIEAHALLLAIVKPLVGHLAYYEHKEIKNSLAEAHRLLDLPLSKIRSAVEVWCSKNFELAVQTTPLPRAICKQQFRSLPRMKTRSAKRYGLNMQGFSPSFHDIAFTPRFESIKFGPVDSSTFGDAYTRPWWVDRPTGGQVLGMNRSRFSVSAEDLSPTSPLFNDCSSPGPASNPECWNDQMGYGPWDFSESSEESGETSGTAPKTSVGQKLKRGLKAIFMPLTGSAAV
ncbi:RNA recognition motif protein [Ceratobasidium sp. AG-Ba]|nr:RNA recognition motif protein [Ceratobasidium sp. AG-Ba]